MSSSNKISLAIASDHGGYDLKTDLVKVLKTKGLNVFDVGSENNRSCDYPDFAHAAAQLYLEGKVDFGILICKSGIGMSIVANRYPDIRAALIYKPILAKHTRAHNDANFLCLASEHTDTDTALNIIESFLNTKFEGGRHTTRLKKISTCNSTTPLSQIDNEIYQAIKEEKTRQQNNIELIASENFTSPAVMEAQGSCLTNKYAEGYPKKRWYGGCENVDTIEKLAIERSLKLFEAEHVNVQPHSGSQANTAVYFSFLEPGDRILTMDLAHGGHLTHGHKANFSGRFYEVTHYGVDQKTETINYDELEKIAQNTKPKMITAGASAYSRTLDFKRLADIAHSVEAYLFVDMAHIAGLVAANVHPSPIPYADFVTTTTHKSLRGPRGGLIFCKKKYAKKINSMVFPGIQGGPLMHVIAAKAVCLSEALTAKFVTYQKQVVANSSTLAKTLSMLGMIMSGVIQIEWLTH